MEKSRPTVYGVTGKILCQLSNLAGTSAGKAMLAKLRNSIGKDLGQTAEIWPIVFANMPDKFLGRSGTETEEEKAVLNTLQLYALYKQGKSDDEIQTDEQEKAQEGAGAETDKKNSCENLGTSLACLRNDDDRQAVDRRFNTMVTSATYDELLYHLRQMISILKAKSKGAEKVDFARLSEDLYWFIRGFDDRVRISWGREYYRNRAKKTEKTGGEKNE